MCDRFRKSLFPVLLALSLAALPATGVAQGLYEMQRTHPYRTAYPSSATDQTQKTYGQQVAHKAVSGLANLMTGWFEIPKNIINTTNSVNLAWGVTGGLFKGVLNMAGRMMSGMADLLTAPLPTKPIPNPEFVWHDFDVDTTYGDVFRLRERPTTQSVQAPMESTVPPPEPEPVPSEALDSAADRVEDAAHDTDQKLDSMFKYYMTK
ncbi:MAG: exosortase system-associated protein, TIGR04073 family [Pseudomonadota bacterium]